MCFSGFNILLIPVLRRRVVWGDIFQGGDASYEVGNAVIMTYTYILCTVELHLSG